MVVERFTEILSKYIPTTLQDPKVFIPTIVAFYVGLLGWVVMGALQKQSSEIRKTREEAKRKMVGGTMFDMLKEDDE